MTAIFCAINLQRSIVRFGLNRAKNAWGFHLCRSESKGSVGERAQSLSTTLFLMRKFTLMTPTSKEVKLLTYCVSAKKKTMKTHSTRCCGAKLVETDPKELVLVQASPPREVPPVHSTPFFQLHYSTLWRPRNPIHSKSIE